VRPAAVIVVRPDADLVVHREACMAPPAHALGQAGIENALSSQERQYFAP